MFVYQYVTEFRQYTGQTSSLLIWQTANWIRSFLTDTYQRVIIENRKSVWANVTSEIPQGSILGPTLFVINDLPGIVSRTVQINDDTKIYWTLNDIGDTILSQVFIITKMAANI